jgi:hypothetical protein
VFEVGGQIKVEANFKKTFDSKGTLDHIQCHDMAEIPLMLALNTNQSINWPHTVYWVV